jgi:shikimate dehydrogenase
MMNSGSSLMAGVIGHPIAHSRSPIMHTYWLKTYGINGTYVPLDVKPENLPTFLKSLAANKFQGVSVTIPHKENVMASLDVIDPSAKAIGAVNMITVLEGGKLKGQNTDGFGFIENIQASSEWESPSGTAVVLGAGGAARAVVYGLAEAGVETVIITNRTKAKAERLADDLSQSVKSNIEVADWDNRDNVLGGVGLLVNTTSLGMTGQSPLEINLAGLPKRALVTDIVYAPLETALLKQAKQRGNTAVDGLGMLMHQARPHFKAWFGRDPEVTPELHALLEADLK